MIQPKRTYGDKIMETLEKIGLSEQEREKIFSYVSGERGCLLYTSDAADEL